MTVQDIYEILEKNSDCRFSIVDDDTYLLIAYCNNDVSRSWAEVHDAIKQMDVTKLVPERRNLVVCVDVDITSSYQSEERCKMDGYERMFVDPLRGPVYAKESFILNPHDGSTESIGYSFAIVEGYI